MTLPIPVVDLFAGPGGLGEGFSRCCRDGKSAFRICVSVEKDPYAHATLTLRSFVRQFDAKKLPSEYYQHMRGDLPLEDLYFKWPLQAAAAKEHTLKRPHEMGTPDDDIDIDNAITTALGNPATPHWVLIGGPPCQAYSLSGRSRRARQSREEFERDKKHFLYEEYLRIIRKFAPSVFVMENVKGLLSATIGSNRVLSNIMQDFSNAGYSLHSLSQSLAGDNAVVDPSVFLVRAEEYGIPQRRHRIFIVGVRLGLDVVPVLLKPAAAPVSVFDAIGDLPHIRSCISCRVSHGTSRSVMHTTDSLPAWKALIRTVKSEWFEEHDRFRVERWLRRLGVRIVDSAEFIEKPTSGCDNDRLRRWCQDPKLGGIANHSGRTHMPEDLLRYFYAAAYGRLKDFSPVLKDFPPELLPAHVNVGQVDVPHTDRFKVQLANGPSSTITCHIAKDGHYYIHHDPTQCRSLTVREAARLQTFPDNYFFEGPRTEQYKQVGNAVPPLLARQIADRVADMFVSASG